MPTSSTATRTIPQVMRAFVIALVVMLVLPTSARAQQHVFSEGHIDAFNVISESGELQLTLKEDITGSHVIQKPEDVIIHVKEDAWTDATAQVPGIEQPTYFLPLVQDHNLIWPGWDTLQAQTHFTSIDINFHNVQGPGEIYLFGSGALGGINPMLHDGSLELKTGSIIRQSTPAHVHANWGFTEPGTYIMDVQATGTNHAGQAQESNRARYTWVVGDLNAAPSAPTAPAPSVNQPAPQQPSVPSVTPSPNQTNTGLSSGSSLGSSDRSVATKSTNNPPAGPAPVANAAAPAPAQNANAPEQCTPGLVPMIKDDRNQPATWVTPESLTFGLGDAARKEFPVAVGPVQPGPVWMIGAVQEPNVPWLGANTQHPSVVEHTTGPVRWDLTSFEGPGNMVVYAQGNLGEIVGEEWFSATPGNPSGSHTVPANTHVHQNWVFDAPGTYKVGITQTATLKDGTTTSGTSTITFIVGGAGNANEGHFDLGAVIDPEGNCGAGAGAGGAGTGAGSGAGAAGAGGAAGTGSAGSSSSSGQLADTGVTNMTVPIAVLGVGLLVLGISYIVSSRVRQLI